MPFTIVRNDITKMEVDTIVNTANDLPTYAVAHPISGGEFAENILADLIAEGYSGAALLDEFRKRQVKIRPAVETLLEKAREAALGKGDYATYEEIFGTEN